MKERHILIPHKPKEKKQAICTEALNKIKEKRKINENKPVRERLSLEDRANKLYDGRGDFGEFTADELAELWAGCMLSKENPYGKAYDDEIYDAIMDMGDVDSNISREIFDKADKIYDEKYHPLFEDTGDDIHEDVNDEKVIFVKQAEDYYDDADDYFDDEYLFSSDGNGLVITGNRHLKSYGDKALIDAINDTYDEKEALDALKEITGVEYEKDEMHGYSQGDWQNIYYPAGTDQKILDEVENMYMGKYDVFTSENDEFIRVPHDISWNGADAIKEYISDEFGYSPDSIVLKKKVSRKVYDDEDFDESLKEGDHMDDFSKRWHEVFDKIQVGTKMKELSGPHAGKKFVVTKIYTDSGHLKFMIKYDGEETQYVAYADDIWDDYNHGKLKFLDENGKFIKESNGNGMTDVLGDVKDKNESCGKKSHKKITEAPDESIGEANPEDVEEVRKDLREYPRLFHNFVKSKGDVILRYNDPRLNQYDKYVRPFDYSVAYGGLIGSQRWYNEYVVAMSDDRYKEFKRETSTDITESIGKDVSEYQKWVDYDMKKYHKISKDTMDKIKGAGLSVVKDQYGDYEVIADRPIGEKCESHKRITEGEELDRNGFVSLIRLGDHPYDGYSVLNDGYFVRRIYAESDDEAIDKFNQFLARKNESCGKKN